MAQRSKRTEKTSVKFYDALAAEYDTMTNMQQRLISERPLFRTLVERFHIDSALDAGCGTGFTSILLAELGVHVTAVDESKEMIAHLKQLAKERSTVLRSGVASFQHLDHLHSSGFDAVFCLGNALGHLLTKNDLNRTFNQFFHVLKPGGFLIVQMLNYERILRAKERIQSIKQVDGKTFVRFYDFERKFLRFNILTISSLEGTMPYHLQSTPFYSWTRNELDTALHKNGLKNLKHFGTLKLEKYRSRTSHDLVILASRPNSQK